MAELCLFNEEFIFDNDMSTCDMFDISYKQGTGHSIKFTKIKFDQVFFNKRSNQRIFLESGAVKNGRCLGQHGRCICFLPQPNGRFDSNLSVGFGQTSAAFDRAP